MTNTRRLAELARLDVSGELLPAEPEPGRELVPYTEPARRWPVIRVELPQADDNPEPAMTWEKRTMQRQPGMESDVRVPIAQAAMTAAAVGVLAGCAAWAFGWPVKTVALVAGVTLAVAWLWRLRLADSLLWQVETLTGHVGPQNAAPRTGRAFTLANPAEARTEAQRDTRTAEHEAARAELLAFVHRCYTVGTSEGAHGVKASGPDRQAYVRQRDVLFSLGIATWKNPERPKAGWKMAVSYARTVELIGKHVL